MRAASNGLYGKSVHTVPMLIFGLYKILIDSVFYFMIIVMYNIHRSPDMHYV
jgi:hypothetical protein